MRRPLFSLRSVAAVLVAAALCAVAGSATGQDGDPVSSSPAEFRAGVKRALSGSSGRELRASFAELDEEERVGWAFLVANTPQHHVGKLTQAVLTEHVQYAYKARRELPWATDLSDELFLHYVLPIQSGDEPPQAYRKQFFEEIVPHLRKKKCKTLEQVALEVNRFCGARVTFKSTPPEDAGPLDILKRGFGRCEEEGIYFNAVARSAGLPARVASTPYWTFKASNHAWCEVFIGAKDKKTGREWGYVGACEPAGKLNQAWFSGDIKRGALVLSRSLGRPASDEVLSEGTGYAVINTTRYYTNVCEMTLAVTDSEGAAVGGADIALYIWNEVGNEPYLHSAFQSKADADGSFAFELGPGEYVVQARKGNAVGWAVATSAPGKKATCSIVLGAATEGPDVVREADGAGLDLRLGRGGKKTKAGICLLDAMPWKPTQLVEVEKKGTRVDLPAGTYLVQTGRRKGDSEIHVTLQVVTIEDGAGSRVTLPGPKQTRPSKDGSAYVRVLKYPRK